MYSKEGDKAPRNYPRGRAVSCVLLDVTPSSRGEPTRQANSPELRGLDAGFR